MDKYRKISVDNSKLGLQMIGDGIKTNINSVNVYHSSPERRQTKPPKNIVFYLPKAIDSFKGRETEIEKLSRWLFKEKKKMITISGLSGYGKTELAKQFVRQCKNNKQIDNILWINSESRDTIEDAFRELLRDVTLEKNLPIRKVLQIVYQYFEGTSTIFVFDNALDRRSFLEFEPTNDSFSLITSHVSDWGEDVPTLEISPLSLSDSLDVIIAVVGKHYTKEHQELYKTLANILSCVPLGLQIAAACIRQEIMKKRSNFNLEKYVEELKISPEDLLDKNFPISSGNTYKNSMCQALKISLMKIDTDDNESILAIHILHMCAYLDPDNIRVKELSNIPYIEKLLDRSSTPEEDFTEALVLLHNHSFIRFGDNITIHRFVQDTLIYVQRQCKKEKYFYKACLKFILSGDSQQHQYAVLKQADKNLETFINFYNDNKHQILYGTTILETLVATGCFLTLINIFTNMEKYLRKSLMSNTNLVREAAVCNQYEILELLLNYGCEINKKDQNGSTALTEAVFNLNLNTVKLLTTHGASINSEDNFGYSVLHAVMIATGLPLYQSRRKETKQIIESLVQAGAKLETVSKSGCTLLHTAAYYLQADMVDFLAGDLKLKVNVRDNNFWTPLHFVCHKSRANDSKIERLNTARVLLEHGASLLIFNDENKTPAEHARDQGLEYLAEFLEYKNQYQQQKLRMKKRSKFKRCIIL